jgi:hypothetical protein
MRRRHPDFKGPASTRDQSHTFKVEYKKAVNEKVEFTVSSTMGFGSGVTDKEFRNTDIKLKSKIYRHNKYNTMRITQEYNYEKGFLFETIELFWETEDGNEKPYMKIEEHAELFVRKKLEKEPTIAE